MRTRAFSLALVVLVGGCATTSESVWPHARRPKTATATTATGPRICECPKKNALAYAAIAGETPTWIPTPPPVRAIFGDTFVAESIVKLESHYGVPLGRTLDPLLAAEFEPTEGELNGVKSTLSERLPLALVNAGTKLVPPNAGLQRLRTLRAAHDEALANGDSVLVKEKRAELWRAYREELDDLLRITGEAMAEVLATDKSFTHFPSSKLFVRVANEAGIAESVASDVLHAAGNLHARRRAVELLAGPQLAKLVEAYRVSLATYVTFIEPLKPSAAPSTKTLATTSDVE